MFNTQSKLDEFQKRLETEVDKIRNELITIKTGKASPALVENIIVEWKETDQKYDEFEVKV